MSFTVEKLEHSMAKLTITVPAADFDKAMTAAYNKTKNRFNVPGFRKGKVPMAFIEKMYGPEVFYEDAANAMINEYYPKEALASELEISSQPVIDVIEMVKGKDFVFTAEVAVKPEVTLGDYKGIEVEKIDVEVTDDEVLEDIKKEQLQNARKVLVEGRAAQLDDEVTLDFEGFVDGVPFDGGKGENYKLVLGSHSFIDTFEDQLVGKNIGEDVEVNVTFPEDYQAEELAGKPAVFKVKIHAINASEYPEFDDELIKDTTEFDTVDEWKDDLREKLEKQAETRAESEFENYIMQTLIDTADGVIPKCMFDHRVDSLIRNFEHGLKQQGMSVDIYLQYTGMDMDSFRETFQERAENEVKLRLALEKIADMENIQPAEEEIDSQLQEVADANNLSLEDVKLRIPMDDFITDLRVTKAIEFVKENAVVDNTISTEKEKSEDEAAE